MQLFILYALTNNHVKVIINVFKKKIKKKGFFFLKIIIFKVKMDIYKCLYSKNKKESLQKKNCHILHLAEFK